MSRIRSSNRIRLLVIVALAFAGGCATTQVTTPRSRVAQDMGCTTDATRVEQIAPVRGERAARWQVTGCGRTAVYLCTTPVRECWREGAIQPEGTPPPAAPPSVP